MSGISSCIVLPSGLRLLALAVTLRPNSGGWPQRAQIYTCCVCRQMIAAIQVVQSVEPSLVQKLYIVLQSLVSCAWTVTMLERGLCWSEVAVQIEAWCYWSHYVAAYWWLRIRNQVLIVIKDLPVDSVFATHLQVITWLIVVNSDSWWTDGGWSIVLCKQVVGHYGLWGILDCVETLSYPTHTFRSGLVPTTADVAALSISSSLFLNGWVSLHVDNPISYFPYPCRLHTSSSLLLMLWIFILLWLILLCISEVLVVGLPPQEVGGIVFWGSGVGYTVTTLL